MRRRGSVRRVATVVAALAGVVFGTPVGQEGASASGGRPSRADFTLTILHNNDGESSLLPTTVDGVEYGGIARFQRMVDTLRFGSHFSFDRGESLRRGVVLLNSGDNYLAGTTFQASQQPGAPFFDGVAVRLLRYDALAIGNHEFDFGPATFARFVDTVDRDTPFVSANLDFSGEPTLADLIGDPLVTSTVVRERGERIGVVGLTTPALPTISSPGGVQVLTDLAAIAQVEVDELTDRGVDKVVLISHLQGLDSEIALTGELRDVDVVIGGGGDEILADGDDRLFPGDEDNVFGAYPQVAVDADNTQVPIVTTPGNYRYVGALQVTFDRHGDVLSWDEHDSGIKLVASSGPGAVGESFLQRRLVEEPVAEFVAGLAADIVGESEVVLDCERNEVRGAEANCGNLIADGLLSTARERAADFGVDQPQVAIQNGGGIRGEIDQPAGSISVADTFRLAPFGNFVAVADDVPAETFRQIIEEGAIALPAPGDGGFVHLAGATVVIDPSFQPRVADQTTGEQLTPGERVRSLVLDDGTVVVAGGVTQDVTVDLAGLNFSFNGGDAYPAVPFTTVGATDQQSLQGYIEGPLGGLVSGVQYPRGGEGRITIIAP
ncbi:MAG: bifunctional metallophosphatase/5'-nucleotidase [Acidimicrobiales bacterium]